MKIWPTISHTTLDRCKSGEIVRTTKSHLPAPLAIVCENSMGSKGLIFLYDNKAIFRSPSDPSSVEIFQYGCEPILLLDHGSSVTSDQGDIIYEMGLVTFFESGCYMNAYHDQYLERPHMQFHFKSKTVDFAAPINCEGMGMAFRQWRLALVNPYIANAEPIEIFKMRVPANTKE